MHITDTIIAALGSIIMVFAYFPQIWHLVRERCAAGISLRAYALWSFAALLLLIHAVLINDKIFILLQGINLIATWTITIITAQYPQARCPIHAVIT